MRTQILSLFMVVALMACHASQPPDPREVRPIDVSVIQLTTTPERFEGKRVRVIGYLHLEFEGNGLYLHREDFEHHLHKNGLWITNCSDRTGRDLNNRYVLVEGTFTGKSLGHMSLWSGTLKDVTRCTNWIND